MWQLCVSIIYVKIWVSVNLILVGLNSTRCHYKYEQVQQTNLYEKIRLERIHLRKGRPRVLS